MRFEWDPAKSAANARKHGITFSEAQQLFESGNDYLELFDETHSQDEDRFIAVGSITRGVAVVVWTERTENTIRIVTARFATERERGMFHSYMDENRLRSRRRSSRRGISRAR